MLIYCLFSSGYFYFQVVRSGGIFGALIADGVIGDVCPMSLPIALLAVVFIEFILHSNRFIELTLLVTAILIIRLIFSYLS